MDCEKVGVLPFRLQDGVELLLVTSKTRKRWIFPKGNLEPDLSLRGTAALEALEEAGIEGDFVGAPLGIYRHGLPPDTDVGLFLMHVRSVYEHYPEMNERDRRWVTPAEARSLTDEPGLTTMINRAVERIEEGR